MYNELKQGELTMKSISKAQALSRDLADKLRKRLAGSASIDTVRESQDSAGWPMIFLSDGGSEIASAAVIAIRIQAVDAVSKDIFGNALIAFAPHNLEIAYELAVGGEPIAISKDILIAAFEAAKTGVKMQVKEIPNATAVSATSMDAASAIVELDDLYWPTKGV